MIYIVGVGPGNIEYLTDKAKNLIKNGDIIIGSERVLTMINNYNDIKGKKYKLGKNLVENLKDIISKNGDKNIVILSTGDPGFSGLLKTVLKHNIVNKNDIEVVPGISSVQVAASRLKISWDEYTILTLHGKRENLDVLIKTLHNGGNAIFLPNNLKEDIDYIIKSGIDKNKKMYVCENLTYPNERIIYDKLKNIINMDFSYMVVCVIKGEDED